MHAFYIYVKLKEPTRKRIYINIWCLALSLKEKPPLFSEGLPRGRGEQLIYLQQQREQFEEVSVAWDLTPLSAATPTPTPTIKSKTTTAAIKRAFFILSPFHNILMTIR